MDPLECFISITDNLPSWIIKLNDYTAEREKEFATEFCKPIQNKPARSRHGSIQSIRDDDEDTSPPGPATDLNPPQYAPLDVTNKDVFATASRLGASGPRKFRNKNMVVVWYNSTIQEGFESLVGNIASARNNLRKGKMSSVMIKGFHLPSLRAAQTSSTSNTTNSTNSKIRMPVRPSAMWRMGGASEETAFDKADKELETAQNLCEAVAHKFLRGDDCQPELESIRKCFKVTLEIGNAERKRLEKKAKAEREKVENTSKQETTPSLLGAAPSTTATDLKFTQPATVGSNMIEVDDDPDGNTIDIDITTFRTARLGNRALISQWKQ
jgi:hypothetical protein